MGLKLLDGIPSFSWALQILYRNLAFMVDMVFTIFKLRNSKIDLSHIFGSFQDSVNIMITWTMRFTANTHSGKLNCDGKIFRGTFHPFVIVLYFYRAHEYKFGEKLAVNGIESLNFWQWCSLAEVRGGKVGLTFNRFQKNTISSRKIFSQTGFVSD